MSESKLLLHVGKYLDAELLEQGRTSRWLLKSRERKLNDDATMRSVSLAIVKWSGPWRQYVLIPEERTIWSKGCLTDVISFLNELNEGHKKKKAKPGDRSQ